MGVYLCPEAAIVHNPRESHHRPLLYKIINEVFPLLYIEPQIFISYKQINQIKKTIKFFSFIDRRHNFTERDLLETTKFWNSFSSKRFPTAIPQIKKKIEHKLTKKRKIDRMAKRSQRFQEKQRKHIKNIF